MTTQEVLEMFPWPAPGIEHWNQIEAAMKEYARIKCLEAIKNTKHKAVDILQQHTLTENVGYLARDIQNIPNENVMPEL